MLATVTMPHTGEYSFDNYNFDSTSKAKIKLNDKSQLYNMSYINAGGHSISICGWGTDTKLKEINGEKIYGVDEQNPVQYWIIRNSWGPTLNPNNSDTNPGYFKDNDGVTMIPKGCFKVVMWPFFNWGFDVPIFCNSQSANVSQYKKGNLYFGGIQVRAADRTIDAMLKANNKGI